MSERLRRIVEQLDIQPDDRVLEIGCGHGVAGTYVCEQLEDGHYTALDRSSSMVAAATRRNMEFVVEGKADFILADFEDVDFGVRTFDKIFAVRVGLFHREPQRARALIQRWLAPGGTIFVENDAPS